MMQKIKHISASAILILLILLVIVSSTSAYAQYDISKSKTATNLNENYESDITISTPINDGNNYYDFVFVLDKSTSGDDSILDTLDAFYDTLNDEDHHIKIGMVAFYNKAEIIKTFEEEDSRKVSGSGTNLSAGILLGTQMLDEDTEVPSSHKYLIIISDGDTHIFNKDNDVNGEPTTIAQAYTADNSTIGAGPDSYNRKYSGFQAPEDWDTYLKEIQQEVENDGDAYENKYNTNGKNRYNDSTNYVPYDEISEHAVAVDKALYYSYVDFQAAKEKGYHTFTVPMESSYGRLYGPSFLEYLNDGKTISMDNLLDITNMVGPGTSITDYIGSGTTEEGIDYNFDVVDDISNYVVKVNNIVADITKIETTEGATSTYGVSINSDGSYKYIINYYADDEEKIEFIYNVLVNRLEPVELTFKVKLSNPSEEVGSYTNLNTNNGCIIKIYNSAGTFLGEDTFENPTVDYVIAPKARTILDDNSIDDNSNTLQELTNTLDLTSTNTDALISVASTPSVTTEATNAETTNMNSNQSILSNIPQTGDLIMLYVILLIIATISFISSIIFEKFAKRSKH